MLISEAICCGDKRRRPLINSGGIVDEIGDRVLLDVRRGVVVERFRRRQNDYHRGLQARRAWRSKTKARL